MVVALTLVVIFVILFIPELISELIWRIRKKRHLFSGKIENYKDVNDFLANYKHFIFHEQEYYYLIVSKTFSRSYKDYSNRWSGRDFYSGIYISENNSTDLRYMDRKRNQPLRAFVWEHRDEINLELERQKWKAMETKFANKDIAAMRKLDKEIQKYRN